MIESSNIETTNEARRSGPPPERPTTSDAIDVSGHWWTDNGFDRVEHFQAMASVLRLHQLMSNAMAAALKPCDLTVNSYLVLATVQLNSSGARLLGQLASNVMVHPTTVTLIVDRLEANGMLVREPHPTDRRATFARITPAGRALTERANQCLSSIDFGLPGMTNSECAALIEVLRPIRTMLGDDGGARRDQPDQPAQPSPDDKDRTPA